MTGREIVTLLLFLAVVVLRPSHGTADSLPSWQKYFFDGKEFRQGDSPSGPAVYAKEGYIPVTKAKDEAFPEDKLPSGTGGVVVLGYIQVAGGKLQNHSGYLPLAGAAIEIKGAKRIMTIRSDGEGYAVLALPAGKYDLQIRGLTKGMQVEEGKTIFVTIRAGKRMVD